jgi:homoserine dehydrogenase
MKIVILGAGQVGASVAESLVSEKTTSRSSTATPDRLNHLQDRLDLRTVVGNAASPSVLRQAGLEDADLADRRHAERPDQPCCLQAGAQRLQRADSDCPLARIAIS